MKNYLRILWKEAQSHVRCMIGEDETSSNCLRDKILEDPYNSDVLVELGSLLISRHNYYEEACYYLTRAIGLKPKSAEAYFWRVFIWFLECEGCSKAGEPLSYLDAGLIIEPARQDLLQLKTLVLFDKENMVQNSIQLFRRVLEQEPDWLITRLQLIHLLIESEQRDEALQEIGVLQRLLDYYTQNPPVANTLQKKYYEIYFTGRASCNYISGFLKEEYAKLI